MIFPTDKTSLACTGVPSTLYKRSEASEVPEILYKQARMCFNCYMGFKDLYLHTAKSHVQQNLCVQQGHEVSEERLKFGL